MVRKGTRNFDVRIIDPVKYLNGLYRVYAAAQVTYGATASATEYDDFAKGMVNQNDGEVIAAFDVKTGECGGWIKTIDHGSWVSYSQHKTDPAYEKFEVSAALVNGLCEHYRDRLAQNDFYICDGERTIVHKTRFQDYLCKYFNFRNAYCKMHIRYRKPVGVAVRVLYPFRKHLPDDGPRPLVLTKSLLRMEELRRATSAALNVSRD